MKKFNILILLIIISGFGYSQTWTEEFYSVNNEKGGKNFYETQKDFNEYWKPFNLELGYYYKDGKKHKASGWKQFKRWEWYWETRIDRKTGEFPEINLLTFQQEYAEAKASKIDQSNWENMGPNSSEGGYSGIGRINCITFHPTNNDIFWIGAPSGGLWKTIDGGNSWETLTESLPILGVSEIVLSNDYESSKTIYIATGDRDGGDNYSIGVLKSTDDGATWDETSLSFNVSSQYRITRLLMNPTNSNIMYASTNGGIFKTDDGWLTNSPVISGGIFFDMEFNPNGVDTLYAANYSYSSTPELFRSTNGGGNWTSEYSFPASAVRVELDVAESNSTIVYALASNQSGGLEGVYKSTNSGLDFAKVFDGSISGNNLLNWHMSTDDTDTDGQGSYDLTISVSPVDENHLYVGGINSWESTDGGVNWNLVSHWYGGFGAAEVHADKHYMEFQDGNTFFEANDGGIYKTINNGVTWEDLTDGMIISQMYKLGVSKTANGEVITGLQDNGSKLISSGVWEDVKGGDGMECIIDNSNANIQYATYVYGQIDRTTNHWVGSEDISKNILGEGLEDGAWVTPYLIDPVNDETLYVGYKDVWKTTDRGDSWTKISNLVLTNKIRSMAIAPSDNNTLYITDFDSFYKTSDGGTNWTNLTSFLPTAQNSITYISVDSNDPLHVWITYGGYNAVKAFESVDGGSSWSNISAGLPEVPANTIVQNKLSKTQQLYAGTDFGVFFKEGSADWTLFSNNLPSVVITELEIYYDDTTPENSILYASTYGRGLWKSIVSPFELAEIQIGNINDPLYISNDSAANVSIPFTLNEVFSSNTFTAYLSDASGDFTSEIAIGDLVSDVAGTITGIISSGTISGVGYKVKVKSSDPVYESNASNSFEIILDNDAPTVLISSSESASTASDPINVTITFSEDVNEFIETDIVVGNGTISSFTETSAQIYNVDITPTVSGSVTVDVAAGVAFDIVGNLNTVATQWSISYTATGIERLNEYGIKIFPNPSNGKFTIEVLKNNSITDISIIDLSGRIIYNDLFSSDNSKEIDLSEFAKGVYILQLNVENEKLVSKIIIE